MITLQQAVNNAFLLSNLRSPLNIVSDRHTTKAFAAKFINIGPVLARKWSNLYSRANLTGIALDEGRIIVPNVPDGAIVLKPDGTVEQISYSFEVGEPSLVAKAGEFTKAMLTWAGSGFPTVGEDDLSNRKAICNSCEFWDDKGYSGMGKCKKCGCSGIKLNLATSKCPVGKWTSIGLYPRTSLILQRKSLSISTSSVKLSHT